MLQAAGLNHFNVATDNMSESVEFYHNLGLRSGHRPEFPTNGVWMYFNDAPVLHLNHASEVGPIVKGKSVVHHVGLSVKGTVDEVITYVQNLGLEWYAGYTVPGISPSIYFEGPSGETVELVMIDWIYSDAEGGLLATELTKEG